MLTLSGVTKSYGGATVVSPLDLDVPAGATCALIGPSGCGKSTVLRMSAGLVPPTAGSVLIGGQTMNGGNARELRRRLGYVIQEGGLFPHLTARENVTLRAAYDRWPRERIEQRLVEMLELTHFPEDGLARYPAELSGGQRQRLSLMRALFCEPQLLLLDEPLGALDPLIRFEMQHELREIFQRLKKAVLLVTHDLSEAAWFGDQIVLMRNGHVVQQGSVDDFVNHPADEFVRAYLQAQRPVVTAL
jgi:osmoprotectant transport system ATP-binding protein